MDMNVTSALTAYAYQSTLSQTGNTNQALLKALGAGQAQAADVANLVASAGSVDPIAALTGGSNAGALTSLAYGASAANGNGPSAIQAMLGALNDGSSALFASSTDNLPAASAVLSPTTTQALARYAYDQSQDPTATVQQAVASAQQTLMTGSLNLLA